jgi:hypothetical protein
MEDETGLTEHSLKIWDGINLVLLPFVTKVFNNGTLLCGTRYKRAPASI